MVPHLNRMEPMPRNPKNPGQVAGNRHPAAKLTARAVVSIRRQWAKLLDLEHGRKERGAFIRRMVRRYGVNEDTVRAAATGQTWQSPGTDFSALTRKDPAYLNGKGCGNPIELADLGRPVVERPTRRKR